MQVADAVRRTTCPSQRTCHDKHEGPGRDPTEPVPTRSLGASRSAAAFFSFLIPGTGQYLTGRPAIGALFLVPLVVAAVAGIAFAGGDPGEAVGIMLQPTVLLGIVVADGVLLVWRLVAIVDAWWHVGPDVPRSDLSMVVLAILLSVTVATHMFVGVEVLAVRDTVETVFASSDDEDDGFGELPAATASTVREPRADRHPEDPPRRCRRRSTPTPSPTPTPTPGRLRSWTVGSTCCSSAPTPDRAAGACALTRSSCSASTRRAARRPSSRSRATW